MNKIIKNVLLTIERSGFEAYIVGGYVRDKFLRKNSYDIDICTNALPKDILFMFKDSIGCFYGTCSFKKGKYNFEITTYRKECKYELRKPVEIEYLTELKDDIVRRDFTINTLCMDKNGKIIDLLEARKDLKNHEIKCVGDIDKKMKEDPLRMLRAIRFASILNFTISDDLLDYIKKNNDLIKILSKDRIRGELNKILLSKNYIYGFKLLEETGLLETLKIEKNKIIYSSDLLVMFSQINIGNEYFTKNEKKQIKNIKNIINYGKIDEAMLFSYGLYLCIVVGEIFGQSRYEINKIYKNMWINESNPIRVTSFDIMNELNIEGGKELGQIKKELEGLILEKKLSNDKKKIIEYLKVRK